MDLSQLIIQAAKWILGTAMLIYASLEAWRLYNKRKEIEAKENSAGQDALKTQKAKLDELEKRIINVESNLTIASSRDADIKEITTKLEHNYTTLMNRLLDNFNLRK